METGQILLFRHAEKADDPLDPHLSPAGRDRALKIAQYIPDTFGRPDFLFASAASQHSVRPIETLQPLSGACGIPINTEFADQDYSALAHEILSNDRYEGKRLVICWHHGNIPSLARALGAKPGSYPDPWNPAVFNLILILDYANGIPSVRRVTEPF
jgi:phosphohistidine phosphatase SixA